MAKLYFNSHNEAYVAFINGDEKGLEHFFSQYYSKMVFYGGSITNDIELAKEIASDSFTKLWESRERIKEWQMVQAFLYRTVYNAAVDYLRKEKSKRRRANAFVHSYQLSLERSYLERTIEANTYERLHKLFSMLPEKSGKVLYMHYFDKKDDEQIAREMGISVYTVRNQRQRALAILKKYRSSLSIVVSMMLALFYEY
jgi:RNA polymerase sigma factor (sigma-70 family)